MQSAKLPRRDDRPLAPGGRREPAVGLGHARAVGPPVPPRAGAPEPRDRAHDERRSHRGQIAVAEPLAVHRAGPEVLHDDVAEGHHLQERGPVRGGGEVAAEAPLLPVEEPEVAAVVAVVRADVRPDQARRVDVRLALDLDDIGPEVGQDHRGERPGQRPREVDHADVGQRPSPGSARAGRSGHRSGGQRHRPSPVGRLGPLPIEERRVDQHVALAVVVDEAARHHVLVGVELGGPERGRDREAESLAGLDELVGPPTEERPGQLRLQGVDVGDELLEGRHARIDQPLQPEQRQQLVRILDPSGGDADPAVRRPVAAGRPAQVVQVRPPPDGNAVDEVDGEGRLEARGDALLGHDLDPAGRAVARQPCHRRRRRVTARRAGPRAPAPGSRGTGRRRGRSGRPARTSRSSEAAGRREHRHR